MAFLNDAWIADPNNSQLYKITNGLVDGPKVGSANVNSVLVSQRQGWIFVTTSDGYVDIFRNNIRVDHIQVGALPVAMTEDINGTLYVACYLDNTLVKITNPTSTSATKVTSSIQVSSGPRDITCDSNNVLFVASYNQNKVDVIYNDIVVDSVPVGLAPRAITCDVANNIWVANYGSNSISKISKNVKALDITLGEKAPVDIVTDSNGIIYCANYLGTGGGSVTMIKINSSGAPVQTVITGVNAPTAIDVGSDNTVYVLSETDGSLYSISGGALNPTGVNVCPNPVAFGDFTGCATYNVFENVASSSSSPMPPYGMSQMDGQIQRLLNKIINADVDTSADKVTFNNPAFPTVEAALNHIIDVDPVVEVFELDNPSLDIFEYGETVTSLQVKWRFSKPMVSADVRVGATSLASLTAVSGIVPVEGTETISGFTLQMLNDRVLTIVAVDENGNTAAVRQTLKLRCGHKILYGGWTPDIIPATSDLDSLNKSGLHTDPFGLNFRIDCGNAGDKVPWIAVPSSWGIGNTNSMVTINGIQFTANAIDKYASISYTNLVGGNETYDVFCLNGQFILSGIVVMQILDLRV